jgi:hypothetical protein
LVEIFIKVAAIGKVGEAVGAGEALEFCVDLGQFGGALGDPLFEGVGVVFLGSVEAGVFEGDGGLGAEELDEFEAGGTEGPCGEIIFEVDDVEEFALVD